MLVLPQAPGQDGPFEILVKRELTLECLQLSSINPLLNNACMPTLKSKLNEVLKISCMSDNMDIFKMGPILPRLPLNLCRHGLCVPWASDWSLCSLEDRKSRLGAP